MASILIKNISKAFDGNVVLKDISLEIADGELLVLLGPSGCGKSTLLRIIAGLETLDSGEIFIGEKRIDRLQPKDRDVALVFQNYALYPHMSVARNLAFPLTIAKTEKKEKQKKVLAVAELLGLLHKLSQKPATLSGGERQRVALGRAIIREPALFLLDEPLSNLDAELRARMRKEIVSLQKRVGRSMIHVTHDQTEALTMADKIALLHDGNLVQVGTPQEIYKNPATIFAAGFIGQPAMNFMNVKIENGKLIPFDFNLSELNLKSEAAEFTAGLRPEEITVGHSGPYEAILTAVEYFGGHNILELDFGGTRLIATNSSSQFDVGDKVSFSFHHSALHFFDPATGKRIR